MNSCDVNFFKKWYYKNGLNIKQSKGQFVTFRTDCVTNNTKYKTKLLNPATRGWEYELYYISLGEEEWDIKENLFFNILVKIEKEEKWPFERLQSIYIFWKRFKKAGGPVEGENQDLFCLDKPGTIRQWDSAKYLWNKLAM